MTGVFLCTCGNRLLSEAAVARITAGLLNDKKGSATDGLPRPSVLTNEILCSADGMGFMRGQAKSRGLSRLVVGGCPAVRSEAYTRAISSSLGLTTGSLSPIVIRKGAVKEAIAAIKREIAVLDLTPVFEKRRVPLRQEVLVVGGGLGGVETAREIASLGYPTTLIEKSGRLGGTYAPGEESSGEVDVPALVEILLNTTVVSLSGGVGDFSARLGGKNGGERRFGAMVIASGVGLADPGRKPFVAGRIVPLPKLLSHLAGLRKRDIPGAVALVLDLENDETKASSEMALRACLAVRSRFRSEVSLLLRDVRVAGLGLEKLYDEAREAGVTVLKYEGRPVIRPVDGGVLVKCGDGVLGEDVEMAFGLAALSPYGLLTPADRTLAEAAGIGLDALAHLQENNVHLLPEQSNRQGLFLVGSCRGEAYIPNIMRDARDAALSVHALLGPKTLEVELSHAVVNGDKCVLCLTCIRTCPFKAMRIFAEEKRAECIPEACRRCGICAGECPNKAIELPAYTDGIVLGRAGA